MSETHDWRFTMGATAPSYWSAVVQRQLERVEHEIAVNERALRERRLPDPFDGFNAAGAVFGPLEADAYFLLVAVRNLLDVAEHIGQRYDAAAVAEARALFDADSPGAKVLRDHYTHLVEYAVGGGFIKDRDLQGKGMIQIGTDCTLRAGTLEVDLRTTAAAASKLARRLNEVMAPDS